MSDQDILTLDQVLAELPTNLLRLIRAKDVRDLTVSAWGAVYDFDPTNADDEEGTAGNGKFGPFSKWVNVDPLNRGVWICFAGAHNAAIWQKIWPTTMETPAPPVGAVWWNLDPVFEGTYSGLPTIGAYTLQDGEVGLLMNSTEGNIHTGPWVVHSGAWTRPDWYMTGTTFNVPALVFIAAGEFNSLFNWDFHRGLIGYPPPGEAPITDYHWTVDVDQVEWFPVSVGGVKLVGDGNVTTSTDDLPAQPCTPAVIDVMLNPSPTLNTIIFTPQDPPPTTPFQLFIDVNQNLVINNNLGVNITVLNVGVMDVLLQVECDWTQLPHTHVFAAEIEMFVLPPYSTMDYLAMHTTEEWGDSGNTSAIQIVTNPASDPPGTGDVVINSYGATSTGEFVNINIGGIIQYGTGRVGNPQHAWRMSLLVADDFGIDVVNQGHAIFFARVQFCR